ncbi:MAG TPA: asparagine synthase (glutamine-hydrolyzing) [Phycisphaerales bacterium]|nr:asparagine synthase (glutamine-hydrolyzing) [Phycisphaerales bacterium]
MCGIAGVCRTVDDAQWTVDTPRGEWGGVARAIVERMASSLSHRGPDGGGVYVGRGVVLGHRRLAVIDPSPAGQQPMTTPDGRFTIVYNGMLYNDAEIRAARAGDGVAFRSSCDTETVLHHLAAIGASGLGSMRGMYALALYDNRDGTLLLARDPFGIKPLYWARIETPDGPEIVFASEIAALSEHPGLRPEPDLVAVSAYLTTIRTTLGDRTLFRGVRTVPPGRWLRFELRSPDLRATSGAIETPAFNGLATEDDLRGVVENSVRSHLRSDVPLCCLLSGGLDSSVVTSVARRHVADLRTWCAGARDEPPIDGVPQSEDFRFAREVSAAIGSDHREAPITRALFAERWRSLVHRTGLPLSTPNEVAINEVARSLREGGCTVALSGEGADELLAGYDAPMLAAAEHVARGNPDPGVFQLASAAWIPPHGKASLLEPEVWRAVEGDAALVEQYRAEYEDAAAVVDEPLRAHLRFHRRVNLTGLLQRLDSATMLEGVEGRTPFADVRVAAVADAVPLRDLFDVTLTPPRPRTKIALRRAFRGVLPEGVVARPKASFPLPFQQWVADFAAELDTSGMLAALVQPAALAAVRAEPSRHWYAAWPLINLALWERRWWG